MTFDPFAALAAGQRPNIHNVRLVAVAPAGNGKAILTVEVGGSRHEIPGGRWSDDWSRVDEGRIGYLRPILAVDQGDELGACFFNAYPDQSLRRIPELDLAVLPDLDGTVVPTVGWWCEARPRGFRAPVGIIPGEGGAFIPDQTVEVTVRVPPEFLEECDRYQLSPARLLRSFVGDLAGVHNMVARPRADGYGSNGSDERDYAAAWLERAHGGQKIDLFARDRADEARALLEDQKDDLGDLLVDFTEAGGTADELIEAVRKLVDQKSAKG